MGCRRASLAGWLPLIRRGTTQLTAVDLNLSSDDMLPRTTASGWFAWVGSKMWRTAAGLAASSRGSCYVVALFRAVPCQDCEQIHNPCEVVRRS